MDMKAMTSIPETSATRDSFKKGDTSQPSSSSPLSRARDRKNRRVTRTRAEMKRVLLFKTPSWVRTRMYTVYKTVTALAKSNRGQEDCWLYPVPPQKSHKGSIMHSYSWTDYTGANPVSLPFGVVALLLNGKLSSEQKENIVKRWEVSHLCGNWTCVNYRHLTIEDHTTNVKRNRCFNRAWEECKDHYPPCMVEKKKPLSELTPSPPSSQESSQDTSATSAITFRQPPR